MELNQNLKIRFQGRILFYWWPTYVQLNFFFSMFRQMYRYFTISCSRGVTRKLGKAILIVIHKILKLQRVRCKLNDNVEVDFI